MADAFFFDFPVFILANPAIGGGELVRSVFLAHTTEHGKSVLIFTDMELAERCIRDTCGVNIRPVAVDSKTLARILTEKGATGVAVDLDVARQRGQFRPVGPVLEEMRRGMA
jgi:hypothetical protein